MSYQVKLDAVTVEFTVYDRRSRSLRDMLLLDHVRRVVTNAGLVGGQLSMDSAGHAVVRALDRVDLHFIDGDRVGLLGHNGAGKTTMLRVMAGIYEPATGTITTEGAVTSFFGVTEGLDIDATGYEAIRLRSKMLGRSNKEIAETAHEIAAFTELGDYLHMPLRTYSSGMMVRLAFAIATSLRPEILLMDEAIGAGDAAFVSRAQARLASFVESSGIMVVATHNADILRRWCNKAVLLAHGKIVAEGDVERVIEEHRRMAESGG
jgi:ABC-2 type transport system ATP-binding protein/lipopolysaccharide transport system ATP-binding protein